MLFKVKPATQDNQDGFEVINRAGKHVEWFEKESDAQDRANWLIAQYDRIMAIL